MFIGLFEDPKISNFHPITYTRALPEVRLGPQTLLQKAELELGRVDGVFIREYLAETFREKHSQQVNPDYVDDHVLLINSRLLLDSDAAKKLLKKAALKDNFTIKNSADIVAVKANPRTALQVLNTLIDSLSKGNYKVFQKIAATLEKMELPTAQLIEEPQQILALNPQLIKNHLKKLENNSCCGQVDPKAVIHGEQQVYVAKGAKVGAYAVLDARKGPIIVDKDAEISPHAVIQGPAYIGRNTVVMSHSYVEDSSIGDACIAGGKISRTILHGYSDTPHAGYISRTYVGEWAYLAPLTSAEDGDSKEAARAACPIIGDAATTLTGTIIRAAKIGPYAIVSKEACEDVPPFTIYPKNNGQPSSHVPLQKAIEIQKKAMAKKGKTLTKAQQKLIQKIYELTAAPSPQQPP